MYFVIGYLKAVNITYLLNIYEHIESHSNFVRVVIVTRFNFP